MGPPIAWLASAYPERVAPLRPFDPLLSFTAAPQRAAWSGQFPPCDLSSPNDRLSGTGRRGAGPQKLPVGPVSAAAVHMLP